MTEPIEIDETLDGYKQCGGNGDGWTPADSLMEAAVREIERQDVAGRALSATDVTNLKESAYMHMDLAQDMVGWQRLSTANNLDMHPQMRRYTVWRARQYTRHDGICKQTVALYTGFGIGTGFQWDVMGDRRATTKSNAGLKLDELIKANPKTFKPQGQRANSDALYSDGETFFVLLDANPTPKIRTIDVLELDTIITHPEDRDTPLLYVRRYMVGTTETVKFYKDWKFDEAGIEIDEIPWPAGVPAFSEELLDDGVVYHVKLKGRGLRGDSGLLSDMDWSRQYRKFMTARAAITLAIAAFVYKGKVKGGQADVNRLRAQMGTAINTSTASGETNPPPVSASIHLENEGFDLSAMKQETGAAAAKVDAGLFIQMAGMGSGIYPQYFGTNSFRLATAAAMEPPMMKAFESYQGLWADVYENIIMWAWDKMGVAESEQALNTTASPIQETNKGKLIESVAKLVEKFPMLASSEDLVKWSLQTLGINDAAELLEALETQVEEKVTRGTTASHLISLLREAVHNQGKE